MLMICWGRELLMKKKQASATETERSTLDRAEPNRKAETKASPKQKARYAVALSFAGPDRTFAQEVASGLRKQSVSVFYDRFEEHELWGRNLHEVLRNVYTRDCRYCILVLTPAYLTRMWPVFERRQIVDRLATEHGQDAVLPVRLDGFAQEIPGISSGLGCLDVRSSEHQRVVQAMLRKLGQVGYEFDSTESYVHALQMLKSRKRGQLAYDRIFTSGQVISRHFKTVISGDILKWEGHEFYWQRCPGEPLAIMAKNDVLEDPKKKGLVTICKCDAPEAWVGCGLWTLAWPKTKTKRTSTEDDEAENSDVLILLYLFSDNPQNVEELVGNKHANAAFFAALYLKDQNAQLFYSLAEENYDDLR